MMTSSTGIRKTCCNGGSFFGKIPPEGEHSEGRFRSQQELEAENARLCAELELWREENTLLADMLARRFDEEIDSKEPKGEGRSLIEIVIMEARAAPRLRSIQGLWQNGCKGTRGAERRPGRMTDFIRQEGLLPPDLIDHLIERAPTEIIQYQERLRAGFEIPSWHDFLESFTPEDGTAGEDDGFIPLAVLDVERMTERILSGQDVREPSLRYAA